MRSIRTITYTVPILLIFSLLLVQPISALKVIGVPVDEKNPTHQTIIEIKQINSESDNNSFSEEEINQTNTKEDSPLEDNSDVDNSLDLRMNFFTIVTSIIALLTAVAIALYFFGKRGNVEE